MFRSKKARSPFWKQPPFPSSDPAMLYQAGISCVQRSDGKGMMAAGWRIWRLAGLHEHQASDFLTGGYDLWRESSDFEPALAATFLNELLEGLRDAPLLPGDIWSLPREVVMPVASQHGARAWAASGLIAVSRPDERSTIEQVAYSAVSGSPRPFVPPRSIAWAEGYADQNGLPAPWG